MHQCTAPKVQRLLILSNHQSKNQSKGLGLRLQLEDDEHMRYKGHTKGTHMAG